MKSIEDVRRSVLVVDDEEDFLYLMGLHLKKKGYLVTEANNPVKAQQILEERVGEFAVLVTDWMMPQMSGNSLVRIAKRIDPQLEAILITSAGVMGATGKMAYGAFDYLTKPLSSMKDLSEMVARAVAHRNNKMRNKTSVNDSPYDNKLMNYLVRNKNE